jgi:hypothetical protein
MVHVNEVENVLQLRHSWKGRVFTEGPRMQTTLYCESTLDNEVHELPKLRWSSWPERA